jgi:hypothetical protein
MRRRNQAEFALEDLDFSWLAPGAQKAARWVIGVFCGLVTGLAVGLVAGSPAGLVVGAITAWLASGRNGLGAIEPMEEVRFSWRNGRLAFYIVNFVLLFGVIGAAFGSIFGMFRHTKQGMISGLAVGSAMGLVVGLAQAVQPRPISGRSAPNRGTLRSLRYALWIALAGWAFAALVAVSAGPRFVHSGSGRVFTSVVGGLVYGVPIASLMRGGSFALRHYAVRLFLAGSGFAPLAYVHFLSESAERLFLLRRGRGYEFFHLTFRDYLADTTLPLVKASGDVS